MKKGSDPQHESMENQSPTDTSSTLQTIEEETKNLNASYSDTSLDREGLPSPPPGVVKIQRKRWHIKGQGWTLVFVHLIPKVEEIKELIREIQRKQEEKVLPLSKV